MIVLPALIMRMLYAVYNWVTGKKPEEQKPAEVAADGTQQPKAKGVCPYHVVLRFFGFPVPEKKTDAIQQVVDEGKDGA